jgi:hypothetical protein
LVAEGGNALWESYRILFIFVLLNFNNASGNGVQNLKIDPIIMTGREGTVIFVIATRYKAESIIHGSEET